MLTIRPEAPSDAAAVLEVNRRAFGRDEEAAIVEAIATAGKAVCSLVAEEDNVIVGHILFTPMVIEAATTHRDAVCLGPLAVVPERHGQGFGSQLMAAGLAECRRLGHSAVFLLGHPTYYPRFGFRPAREFDIHYEDDRDAFMAIELTPGALDGISGTAVFAEEFH